MRKVITLLCLLMAIKIAAAAGADRTVNIGGLEIPADCPLVRKEHPRLLFTRSDLPRLRARLSHPRIAKELVRAKDLASKGKASAVLLGILWQLTGDRKYAEAGRERLQPTWIQTYPLAADLLMDSMSPEEADAEAARIVSVIRENRWRPHIVLALAAWGHGHDEFLAKNLKIWYERELVSGVRYNNRWSRGRGGSSMAHGYYGEHFYSERFTMAVAATNALGIDWVSKCDFAAHTPSYYIYHYRPWYDRPSVIHIGVTAMCSHWQSVTPQKFEGENLAVLAATRFHDGLGQWWIDEVISKISMGWGKTAVGHGGVWGKLLWYDPELKPIPPDMLPPTRLFPENGHVVMRSSWQRDATFALFRCGRFGEIDGLWGRNNADNLHFIIGKNGILAPDTGGVHSLNNKALGFAGTTHVREYARQTIAHNSITVGREPIELRGWRNKLLGVVRRGGQSPIQDPTWWKMWGLPKPKPGERGFKEGEIIAYETSPIFDYACGDATHSYPPTRVKSITRQFVYLRPDTFVIFDRVEATKPELEKIWLLHSLYRPAWNGTTQPDPSARAEKQFVTAGDGTELKPNPAPGGHYIHTDGDTFTIDDRWKGMTGRLFVKLLLPKPSDRVVKTIGGKWHEFEVDGINYGPTEETYTKHHGRDNGHNRENTIGVEGWRIEMSPKQESTSARFLCILYACDQTTGTMPDTQLVESDGMVGVNVSAGDRVFQVTFRNSGEVGGHIRVSENGRILVDKDLATNVQDNYRNWRTDPRYQQWITDPAFKTVIGKDEAKFSP